MATTTRQGRTARAGSLVAASLLLAGIATGGAAIGAAAQDEESAYPPLPEGVADSGVLRVGSQQTYTPAEFLEEGSDEVVGFTADIIAEIARRLGLEVEWVHSEYSQLIPGMKAGRFDMGSGGMSANPDRLEVVDMIGFFKSGATFIFPAEDAGNYADAQSFCGLDVGAIQGATTIAAAIELENEVCAEQGLEPINIVSYENTPQGYADVLLGRIAAYLPDPVQAAYFMGLEPNVGKYAVIDPPYFLTEWLVSLTFDKDQDTAFDAVLAAITEMMEDGTYDQIMEEWGVSGVALDSPQVNVVAPVEAE